MPNDKFNLEKRYQLQLPSLKTVSITLFIGLVVGYLGPFGSFNMTMSSRLLYWVLLISVGHFIYAQINDLCDWYFKTKVKNKIILFVIPIVIGAAILSFFVEYISHLYFNLTYAFPQNFLFFYPKVLILSIVLNLISLLIDKTQENHIVKNNQKNNSLLLRFFDRLPKKLGTDLICFSMEDHYLHIHTLEGSHMLLLRMKDALIELEKYDGFQVHRSWWVATDAIIDVKKQPRKAILIMKNNIEVPVSQKYLPVIKQAGWV